MNALMFVVLSVLFLGVVYVFWIRRSFYSKAELVSSLRAYSDPGREAGAVNVNQLTEENKPIQ